MARPALLIGLGGTGQWVLTYVKKELLDYTKSEEVPNEVRLLAFDTARHIDEKKKKPDEEEPIVVEGVRLGLREFYHLGGNIERIVREIVSEQKHSHIASWLQSRTYLTRLAPGQYLLEEGAGQMRPFGRMAIFKDLQANPETSVIFGTLRDAIFDIRREVKEDRNLEISIISSLAGGTGAGMAIDVAHIVRTIAEDAIGSQKFVIRGFFVLPRAFQHIPGGDSQGMRARSFAAIRELSRFLTVFGDRNYPMIYNPHPDFQKYFQEPVKKRLFDLCYLIDAHRDRNSLDDVEAKHGVFPSIADAILSFLDDQSGQVYTEHAQNMMSQLNRGDDVAYFSALGTYSFNLPIHDIAEENASELAIDFIKRLVKPQVDNDGRPVSLSPHDNQEMLNKRGADLANSFMKDPGSVEGIKGSLFLSEVVRNVEQGGARNDNLVEQAANRSNMEWLQVIEPDDTTPEIIDLRNEVREIIEHSLRKDVKSSREMKVKPEYDVERVEKDVNQYRTLYLGRELADGTTTGGKFREGLDRYEKLQIERYQKGLGEFCVKLLNGVTEMEPEVSKSGKLGFVVDFLHTIANNLDRFTQFMERIREIRSREGRLRLKREEVQAARNQMLQDRKKAGLLKKTGYSSQEEFLDLITDQVELEKDELLFNYVNRISRKFLEHTIAIKDVTDSWAKALALGSSDQVSLYDLLLKARQQVRARRDRSLNFERVRKEETDDEFEQRLYKRFADQQLNEMFRSVMWKVEENGKEISMILLGKPLMYEKRRDRDRPTEHNLKLILTETRKAFQSLANEETIGNRLIDRYSSENLSNTLFENGSPLISFRETPRFGQASNFLAVKYGIVEGDEQYFLSTVEKLGDLSGAKEQQAQLVQSNASHKCTLVFTKDVLNPDSLTPYDDLYDAYRAYTDDRRLLHNFPAEVNAVGYEQAIVEKLRHPYRMFSSRIVFMLEYKDWVRQFTRCMVYDLVQTSKDEEGNPFYVLNLPECEYKGKRFSAEVTELTEHATGKPDLLQAMDTFVFRRKDFRKDLLIPIHYDHVVGALILAEKNFGDEAECIKKIESIIKNGFVYTFKSSDIQFERDLGDLMHLILLDEIDRLSIS